MPPKTLFRMGLSFLFFALTVYFSAGRWINSRIFVPLDYPVSLDTRQLQSPPFQVNLRETYFALLDLDESMDDVYQDNRCNFKTILYPQWRVYKLGSNPGQPRELWVSSAEPVEEDHSSNAFRASPGQYQLQWDIPVAANCLNPRHPRLVVFTDSSGYRESVAFAQLLCIFFGGTGFALVVIGTSRVARDAFSLAAAPRMFPDMALRNFMPLVKHRPLPVLLQPLQHWGIFSGVILWILVITFMMFGPQTPSGLFVSLRNREVAVLGSPAQETLGVYVGPGGRFFVNGEEVRRDSLRARLLEHLARSVSWTVYFEADADTVYMDDVYAIDTIQGCGAKLIWITPKMREEWKRKEQSPKPIP
jgi:biopolymer transport protein ExbD